ncbi:MAG: ribonuclease R [Flavobacteriales bacterium]
MKKAKKSARPKGGYKQDLRRSILDVFERSPKKPLNHKQISAELGIKDTGVRTLIFELLQSEVESGKLQEVERGKFILLQPETSAMEGIIQITKTGRAFVSVPGLEDDISIEKGETGFALNGDTVEIAINHKARKPKAHIVRVVQRAKKQYVGILQSGPEFHFFLPTDYRIHVDFYIPKEELNGARNGDKVIAEITEWTRPDRKPFAKITRVLGKPGSHQVEMHAIMAEYDLPTEFPEAVESAADAIPSTIREEEIKGRRDMRGVPTFTIDPYDAKDFDDALSFQRINNETVEVGVHIADVSHYVLPNDTLDKEAYTRATSVYLVDRTIPMLPEKLSNELCSLRPNEDKLCFSAVFEINLKGEVLKKWFGRTVIHSDRRFTYEEAQTIIEEKHGEFSEAILALDSLAKRMRQERFKQGAIDFNTEEVKFKLDELGKPIGVTIKKMRDSNQLIEEFMLLANRCVGEFIGKRRDGEAEKTYIYRVHDTPDESRLQQLKMFVKHLGYAIPKNISNQSAGTIRAIMKVVEGQSEEGIIRQMAIRTMAKAEYSTDNIGHFGLAFSYYTHFPSPIRRYPDVIAHRLLQHYLDGGSSVHATDYEMKCKHSSQMEKRAAEAERASIKYKQVEYMMAHIGETFSGIVSSITGWGFYVEVGETKSEGLVSLASIRGDRYEFISDKYILYGIKTRHEIHMGDHVTIRVERGDLNQRTLEFSLISFDPAP